MNNTRNRFTIFKNILGKSIPNTTPAHLQKRGAIIRAVYHERERCFIQTWWKHPITNHFNLYFRLTNWQIVQNAIVTYLGYQDIMKDVFLFAKLILSLKVATVVSDPCVCHDFAIIVSFFLKIIWGFNWITQELMILEKQEINQS